MASLKLPSTTSNANDIEVGNTGEFDMAMSVAEADAILARFSEQLEFAA